MKRIIALLLLLRSKGAAIRGPRVTDRRDYTTELSAINGAAFGETGQADFTEFVHGALLALGGPACAADATELEDAEIFLDELERLEEAGTIDLELLSEQIAKLYALPDVEAGPGAV